SLLHVPAVILFSQITVTQSPGSQSVVPGETVSISCRASQSTWSYYHNSYMISWYLQKPGKTPKLLISKASTLQSGASDRFSGSGSGRDFTLTISGVQAEDSGVYSCQTSYKNPPQSDETETERMVNPHGGEAVHLLHLQHELQSALHAGQSPESPHRGEALQLLRLQQELLQEDQPDHTHGAAQPGEALPVQRVPQDVHLVLTGPKPQVCR
uniref:Ig-like domain-containing protein n=1 Tax=Acanthochromis polyacanthus TaxID=80966 RepID=A0A3Q1F4Q7_9TELE